MDQSSLLLQVAPVRAGLQQRSPRIVAAVPALQADIPDLPNVPALAELERWHAMSDEHVLALMPYVFHIQ